MALKFSMILEAVDRASAPARKVKASVSGLVAGLRSWGQQVRKTSNDITSGARSLEFYQTRARRLRQVALGTFFRAAGEQARRFGTSLKSGIRNLNLMERAGGAAKSGLGWLGGKALGLAKWGAAAGFAAGGFALFDLFKTAGQFEQYQVMLEVMEGSAAKAKKSMSWIQNFAQTTPFELSQVTEAFTVLRNAGLDPMNGLLRSTGDAAAGMSADIVDAAKAVADASNGQFERLIDLGITASTKGNNVRLTWVKNGKQIEKVASKADKVGLAMAVAAAWSDKFAGSSDRQSKTLFGMISNLKDAWSGFLLRIANAGIFDKVKAWLQSLLDKVAALAESGQIDTWAKNISDWLGKAFEWATNLIENADWKQLGREINDIANAAKSMASAINSIAWFFSRAQDVNDAINEGTSPVDRMRRLYRKWNPQASNADQASVSKEQRDKLWQNTNPGKGYMRLPRTATSGSGSWRRLPQGGGKPQASASQVTVGGSTKVEIALKGPITGRVISTRANNPNVPMVVNTGKIMAGPA